MASSGKRRRWPWIVAGFLVVLVLVAALVIPALLKPERYRSRIEAALQSATGWEAELGDLDFSIARGMMLTVSPGTLRAPGDSSRFQIETLAIKADLWPLLRGQLDIQSVFQGRSRDPFSDKALAVLERDPTEVVVTRVFEEDVFVRAEQRRACQGIKAREGTGQGSQVAGGDAGFVDF